MLNRYKKILKQKGELYLRIKVKTQAQVTGIKQIFKDKDGEIMKIDIAAVPIKGKANRELIKFLADQFNVNRNNVSIVSGTREKFKLVKIFK